MLNYQIFFFGLPLPLSFAGGRAGNLTMTGLPLFPLAWEAWRGGVSGVAGGGVNTTIGSRDVAGGQEISILETRISGGPAFLFTFSGPLDSISVDKAIWIGSAVPSKI